MDPISNVDRLVMLLRQRLQGRVTRDRSAPALGQQAPSSDSIGALRALAAAGEADERQLRRTLVQVVLAEGLGSHLLNEARFQQIVDRVTETLEAEPGTAGLLARAIDDLRSPPR